MRLHAGSARQDSLANAQGPAAIPADTLEVKDERASPAEDTSAVKDEAQSPAEDTAAVDEQVKHAPSGSITFPDAIAAQPHLPQ